MIFHPATLHKAMEIYKLPKLRRISAASRPGSTQNIDYNRGMRALGTVLYPCTWCIAQRPIKLKHGFSYFIFQLW